MWTREELKMRAKEVLSDTYWKAFIVSIVLAFADGGSSGGSSRYSMNSSSDVSGISGAEEFWPIFLAAFLGVVGILMIIGFLLKIFIGNPLIVGGQKYFVQSSSNDTNMSYLGHSFKSAHFWNVVKTMLIRDIFLFLWFLLLIVPGIIKSYAYRMVPYILADNPEMDFRDAIKLSEEMTYGHKFDIFVLDLSFIGWYLLGALACGFGIFFVYPYYYQTQAELYLVLRDNIIEEGLIEPYELNIDESVFENTKEIYTPYDENSSNNTSNEDTQESRITLDKDDL